MEGPKDREAHTFTNRLHVAGCTLRCCPDMCSEIVNSFLNCCSSSLLNF
jgi:hypothetical protein